MVMYSKKEEYDRPKTSTHNGLCKDNSGLYGSEVVPESAAIDIRDFKRVKGYFTSRASEGSSVMEDITDETFGNILQVGTTHYVVGQHKNYPTIKLVHSDRRNEWWWEILEKIDNEEDDYSPLIGEAPGGDTYTGIHPIVRGETIGELFNNPQGRCSEEWGEKRWELYECNGESK
jgi:hypothetical protein